MNPPSTDVALFDALYRDDDDPFKLTSSPHEHRRHAAIMASLGSRRFTHGFEPGCSIGVLTRRLAVRCKRVFASDCSERAVQRAGERCADLPNVTLGRGTLPDDVPAGPFDLVVLSECLCYLDHAGLQRLLQRLASATMAQAFIVACHGLDHQPLHRQNSDAVHQFLRRSSNWIWVRGHREQGARPYALDVWRVRHSTPLQLPARKSPG